MSVRRWRSRQGRRCTVAALSVVLGAAALAACGGDSHPTAAKHPGSTTTTTSSTSTTTTTVPAPKLSAAAAALIAAYRSTEKTASRFQLTDASKTITDATISYSGTGAVRWDDGLGTLSLHLEGAMESAFGESNVEERFYGTTLFLKLPASALKSSGSTTKPWLGITDVELGGGSSIGVDPAQVLDLLDAGGGSVTKVGAATVGGVATTAYRVHLDVADSIRATTSSATKALLTALDNSDGIKTLVLTAYVDGRGRVSELRETGTTTATSGIAATTGPLRFTVTLDLSDFGVAGDVDLPSASSTSVLSFSEFQSLLASELEG